MRSMFGFNWIDIIIVGLLIGAAIVSLRIGFLRQICVITGFFSILFLAGWLFPHILPIQDRTILTIVNANLVLLCATYAAIRSFDIADKLHRSLRVRKLKDWEAGLGIMPGVAATLITVWLGGTMIGRMPFEGFSNSVNDALIMQKLDDVLPPVPAVFAVFNRVVDPNSSPYVFAQPKPQSSFEFSPQATQTASSKSAKSIVRITSFGCGGIVTGSGFAVGQNLVATNAHVVAGVKRPIIKHGGYSFEAVPVIFDANLDLAILRVYNRVHQFTAPTLSLAKETVDHNKTVAVLGYPGGNYTSAPGIIRSDRVIFGRNIYDLGVIGRHVYEVQAKVEQGSSGGPIVLPDGRVAGIIFAQSDTMGNYAYALTSSRLYGEVDRAESSYRRVSTGTCLGG